MKLSIITVNLNNVNGLKKTIDSVISQTYRDFEWIVIDGGSTDGSKELLEQYSEHFAYWVSEKDSGIYNAMNKGVQHAKGEYLQFLNSGDWLADNKVIEDVIPQLHTDDIIYCNLSFYKSGKLDREWIFDDNLSFYYLLNSSIGHCSSFIKRKLLEENPYDEKKRIVSDWEFFIKMALHNKSYRHYHRFVSCFDNGGVSSVNKELIKKEKKEVISRIVPKCILNDYDFGKTGEMLSLRNDYPLYGKLLTASVLLVKKMTRK